MHQLRLFLISTNKTFVELPFESALAGFFSAEVCEALQTLAEKSGAELSLLNLNRDV
jgi:hypothetical protein